MRTRIASWRGKSIRRNWERRRSTTLELHVVSHAEGMNGAWYDNSDDADDDDDGDGDGGDDGDHYDEKIR